MEQEKKTGMNGWVVAILIALTALIVGTVVYFNIDTIDKWTNYRPQTHLIDESAEQIQQEIIDSVEITENPSIVEYLQFREDIREQKRIENVFLEMPTVVIIDILRQHGTALSVNDIVRIYEDYPDIYNTVQSGARSQQYMDSIYGKKPDELPKQAPIDSVIDTWHNK